MNTILQKEPKRKNLLIVDDMPDNLAIFNALLKSHYDVQVTDSGPSDLLAAEAEPRPDLILLDIMMPEMDGYEVLKRLKDNPRTQNIPVIFVTALNGAEDEALGFALGAMDYISKPVKPPIVLARIRAQLDLKEARDILRDQNAYLEAEVQRRQLENQQVQLQLLQSEKLTAIGRLAAGIAHEINNPIGFVSSNLNTLKDYMDDLFMAFDTFDALATTTPLPSDALQQFRSIKQQKNIDFLRSDIPHLIAESYEGISRVKSIIQDLRSFSHMGENKWQLANMHQILDSTLDIIWNELKYHCTVRKHYGEIPEIYCLPSQINQVFMNLLVNASQAIKAAGTIDIRTGQSGDQVWVEITDSGEGIPPEHINRLFEPFFTTKPVGKGTGLGLSISQNIVKKHQGVIEVTSQIGQGTTFRVVLPINPQKQD